MIKNVGRIDRFLRLLLALALMGVGLFLLDGMHGDLIGILVAATSLLPWYMVITRSCFVFRWFRIHSLSEEEEKKFGYPYPEEKKTADRS